MAAVGGFPLPPVTSCCGPDQSVGELESRSILAVLRDTIQRWLIRHILPATTTPTTDCNIRKIQNRESHAKERRLSGRGPASRLRRLFHRPRISLALAGGGCKAFFSLGVGKVLLDAGLPIHCISGTSAGSAMAMGLIGGFADDIVRFFCQITHRNRANFYWSRHAGAVLGWLMAQRCLDLASALSVFCNGDRGRFKRVRLADEGSSSCGSAAGGPVT